MNNGYNLGTVKKEITAENQSPGYRCWKDLFIVFFSATQIKGPAHTVSDKYAYFKDSVPDADTLMDPTKSLKDEETGILNKILKASDQEEVIHQNLKEKDHRAVSIDHCIRIQSIHV